MDGKKSLRNLILLLQGQFVTNIGNRIYDIAMLLWIKELTGSAAIMGLAMLVTNLPEAVLAPMGGKIADRYGKVRCIVTTDLISAVAVGVLVAVMLLIDSTTVFIIALCAVNLVLGMSSSCFIPAVSSLIPDLVPEEHLERGNAAQQFSQTGAKAIGQGIGGLVFSLFGALGAFAINAVTFLLSAVSESFIRVPERKVIAETEGVASSLMHQTVDVLRYLWRGKRASADRSLHCRISLVSVLPAGAAPVLCGTRSFDIRSLVRVFHRGLHRGDTRGVSSVGSDQVR